MVPFEKSDKMASLRVIRNASSDPGNESNSTKARSQAGFKTVVKGYLSPLLLKRRDSQKTALIPLASFPLIHAF